MCYKNMYNRKIQSIYNGFLVKFKDNLINFDYSFFKIIRKKRTQSYT